MPNTSYRENLAPREVLFANPNVSSVRISPNGKCIAYLANTNGVMNLFVSAAENLEHVKHLTHITTKNISSFYWCYDNEHIVYLHDELGDENYKVYCASITTKQKKTLVDYDNVQTLVKQISPKHPSKIVIEMNYRRKDLFDLYIADVRTCSLRHLFENNKYTEIILDYDFNIRFGVYMTNNGGQIIDCISINSDDRYNTKVFMELSEQDATTSIEDKLATKIIGFNKDATKLWLADSRDADTSGLGLLDISTKETEILYRNSQADIEKVLLHPLTKEVIAISYNSHRVFYEVLDQSFAKDFELLQKKANGEDFNITSMSLDCNLWIIKYYGDISSKKYFLYNREKGDLRHLFTGNTTLQKFELSPTLFTTIEARDGLELKCYITLPKNRLKVEAPENRIFDPENVIQSDTAPLVLLVHGGPTYRDRWGSLITHQWLADRGYVVLSVNYRGSSGFGKSFVAAGNGEWADKMHNDLIDAVQWAVGNRICAKDQVAIMGRSYGGYAALLGATIAPEVFACAIDIVGPSNLETVLETCPQYWKPLYNVWKRKMGGDIDSEEGRQKLRAKSPITYIDNIKKPLLIVHGAHDIRVKSSESEQIVSALQTKNIPVTYLLYPDEGHSFSKPQNNMSFLAVVECFLALHLKGGKFEPTTKRQIEATSMQLKVGTLEITKHFKNQKYT